MMNLIPFVAYVNHGAADLISQVVKLLTNHRHEQLQPIVIEQVGTTQLVNLRS